MNEEKIQEKPTPPPRIKKRRLAATIIILAIILAVLNVLIDNPYTHATVRALINKKLGEAAGLQLSYQSIKVGLLPPKIEFFGTQVLTQQTQSKVVSASRIVLKISYWSLFLANPKIGVLEITDLDGSWPLPDELQKLLDQPSAGPVNQDVRWPPKFDFPLNQVILNNARFFLQHDSFRLGVEGLDARLTFKSWTNLDAYLKTTSLNVVDGKNSLLENGKIELIAGLNRQTISVSQLEVNGDRIHVVGNAEIDLDVNRAKKNRLDHVVIKSQAKAQGDFSVLGSFLDFEDTRGKVDGDVNVTVNIPVSVEGKTVLNIDGHGFVQDAMLYGFKLFDARADFNINLDRVKFSKIEVEPRGKPAIIGKGEISLNDAIDLSFEADPQKLHFDDLLEVFGVDFKVLDFTLTGKNLVVKGTGDPLALNIGVKQVVLDDFDLPSTPMDRSKIPKSPDCIGDLSILVTEKSVDLSGSEMSCRNRNQTGFASPLHIFGNILLQQKKMNLGISSERFDLGIAEYFVQLPMSGTANFQTNIEGPFSRVLVNNTLKASNTNFGNLELGDVSGAVVIDDTHVRWKNFNTTTTKSHVKVQEGSLRLNDFFLSTNFDIQGFPKEQLKQFFGAISPSIPVSFGIDYLKGDLSGQLYQPFGYQGSVKGKLYNMYFEEDLIADNIDVNVDSDKNGIEVKNTIFNFGSMSAAINAGHKRLPLAPDASTSKDFVERLGLNPNDPVTLHIKTQKGSAEAKSYLQGFPVIKTYLVKAGIDGILDLDVKLQGTLSHVDGTVDGALRKLTLFNGKLAPLVFNGTLTKSKLDLRLSHSGQSLRGRLTLDLFEKDIPYDWFFTFNRLELRALLSPFLSQDPRNYMYFTGSWSSKGHLLDWWRSVGKLELNDLMVHIQNERDGEAKTIDMRRDQPVTIIFEKDRWHFEKSDFLFINGDQATLRIGLKDARPPNNLNVQIDSVFDVGILSYFLPDVETSAGKVQLTGGLSGSIDNLKMRFDFSDVKQSMFTASQWQPVSIGLTQIRPPLKNIKFKASLENDGFKFDSFEGDKGNGKIRVNGFYKFQSGEATEGTKINISLDNASVVYPIAILKSFESNLTGNMNIAGKAAPYVVTGDIAVKKARSNREVDIRNEIISSFRSQRVKVQSATLEPLLKFDLNILADKSISIVNRNMQILMSSTLHLTGNDIQPVLSGQTEIDKGKFVYKRDFQIQKGLIIFDDPVKIDPNLDIAAVSEVGAYRVYINISGRASEPVIDFSVDPPTQQDGTPIRKVDILVLLSRGSLPSKQGLNVTDTGSQQNAAQNAATAEALNLLVGQFEDPVEKLFDLSGQTLVRQVYIDTYPSPEDGSPIARFNMPLNLGEDLDVILKVDKSRVQVTSEYALNPNIFLSGGVESRSGDTAQNQNQAPAETGVDLKFRFSFQ